MKFDAKREWCWATVFTRGLAFAFLLLAAQASSRVVESGRGGMFPLLLSIGTCLVFLWLGIQEGLKFTFTQYEITDTELRIRYGLQTVRISLESIRQVVRSRCALPCAFSNHALKILYFKGRLCGHSIVVAPLDQHGFLQLLRDRSPACEMVGLEFNELSQVADPARSATETFVPTSTAGAPCPPDIS